MVAIPLTRSIKVNKTAKKCNKSHKQAVFYYFSCTLIYPLCTVKSKTNLRQMHVFWMKSKTNLRQIEDKKGTILLVPLLSFSCRRYF